MMIINAAPIAALYYQELTIPFEPVLVLAGGLTIGLFLMLLRSAIIRDWIQVFNCTIGVLFNFWLVTSSI